ncbi:winged helix-turn-helix domain-containing protein [Mesorhizobium sp. VK24D]|uniref:Winged helix-turn-helix domain-containing protein n=1 Tax=Mesorhizobium album TaxID=3072314 RepID=A0ABU4Y082_9HYPH|nr:winged helix-turn-helix domain-containing protein [Mesorhizobium sp. VK24D]MDX8480356.1 winged helix-turn-helix domain-containing protein [Mesorhizobium sp. VK24D]
MQGCCFVFGPFALNAETGTLFRQNIPVPVGYRALLLLEALVKRPGEVLTKSQLIDAAWPGTAIEEGNLAVQIASLRKLLGATPDGQDWIATVPRVGYRFTGEIERLDGATYQREAVESGPSIAVLPFVNLSDDVHQQYFGDGLAEDIITRLARLRWLFVSARNSSFTYGAKAVDVKQVGRELGVRYVLDGSVRRSGQRLRITARASDAHNGRQIWVERYDLEMADFFALQDQIAESVIGAIEPRLYVAEHERFQSRAPGSLDAWGFAMKAMPYVWTWGSAQEIELAERLLAKATDIDPEYPRANCLRAWALAARVILGLADPDALPTALDMAHRAIRGDPEDPWTHFAAGFVHMASRHFDQAVAALTEAIVLNPSFAFAHVILGCTYGYGSMPEDGLHHLAIADRLSPRDFTQAANLSTTGLCHFVAKRFAQAAEYECRAVELRPHFGTAWRTLAASAGMAGDRALARQALSQARRLHPSLSVEWIEKHHPIVHERDRALYIKGLSIAGLS